MLYARASTQFHDEPYPEALCLVRGDIHRSSVSPVTELTGWLRDYSLRCHRVLISIGATVKVDDGKEVLVVLRSRRPTLPIRSCRITGCARKMTHVLRTGMDR